MGATNFLWHRCRLQDLSKARFFTRSLYPFRSLRSPLDIPPDNTDPQDVGNVCVSSGRKAYRFPATTFRSSLPGSLQADCFVLTDAALKAFLISLIRRSRVL